MSAETLVPNGSAISLGSAPASYSLGVLANGDLYLAWDITKTNGYSWQLLGQEFTSSGAAIGSATTLDTGYQGTDQYGRPVDGYVFPDVAGLSNGGVALSYSYTSFNPGGGVVYGEGTQLILMDSSGTPYDRITVDNFDKNNLVIPVGAGDALELNDYTYSYSSGALIREFDPQGSAVSATTDFNTFGPLWAAAVGSSGYLAGEGAKMVYFDGSSWAPSLTATYMVMSAAQLANGKVVLVELYNGQGPTIYTQVFDPATDSLGAAQVLYSGLTNGGWPHVVATADGGYVVDWTTSNSTATGLYVDASGQVGAPFSTIGLLQPTPSGQFLASSDANGTVAVEYYSLQPVGAESFEAQTPIPLSASQGWTSAAVLSNGALAVAAVQSAYGQAYEQTYDATGKETGSYTLPSSWSGYGAPNVTALPLGGFYEVTYAGSSNYEIYNANDQQVFVHNQYASPTATFSALANGGYITMDPTNSSVFGLYDASNSNVGWFSLPSDAPGTPTVNALNGGGFVFTYAGTNHFDLYDASGDMLANGNFSAAGSQFAQGFAPLAGNGNGFLEAWLSPNGSTYYGVATSLDIQAVTPNGVLLPVLTVTQDLDPWHTQLQLQAHADGSVAVLWSEGGAVFGAEYAGGAVSSANQAGVLGGDLAHTIAVELPNDEVGFAWLQNGDAWAEIFNPATGAVQRVDLGSSSSSDLSTLHALATAQSGLAVSWHQGSGVEAAVLDSAGVLGPSESLRGDLLGVNTAGQAVTVYDIGGGAPLMQTLTLNDGLFWVH